MALQSFAGYVATATDGVTPRNHPGETLRNFQKFSAPQQGLVNVNGGQILNTNLVQSGSTPLTVKVVDFAALLFGPEAADQGAYSVYDSGGTTGIGITAPSSQNRYDTLLVRVGDPQYGTVTSGNLGAVYNFVQGTPGSSPTPVTDAQIASTFHVPGAWMRLADILVQPADASRVIPQASITAMAPWSLAYPMKNRVVIPYTTFSALNTEITLASWSVWPMPAGSSLGVAARLAFGNPNGANLMDFTTSIYINGTVYEFDEYAFQALSSGASLTTSYSTFVSEYLVNTPQSYTAASPLNIQVRCLCNFAQSSANGFGGVRGVANFKWERCAC